ncbi:MAG TPA: O-succinylhomoserine sulfhydrylase, partial [Thermopetrobacter sp.]|nr:O-succinylhomoserine sulfhydrylase [Thermopetrobacter sp.]
AEGFVYSRYANPTVRMFEERLAALEGAESAMATASGMAAVFAALASHLTAGDHIVAARQLFGSCHQIITSILPRFGIEYTLVDGADLDQWRAAIRPNTKAAFLESPANPTLAICDIAAIADIVHAAGAMLVVDNVFATPVLQKPLALGADVVVYSATKHIDGQGRVLGGCVLGSEEFITETLQFFLRHTGATLSAFNAWVLLKGLETLKLRVNAMSETAARLAAFLEERLGEGRVLYPHLDSHPQAALARKQMEKGGTLVTFRLQDDRNLVFRFMNALTLIDISNNLGDAKSLITHPASTTHSALEEAERLAQGVTEGMVRLSVGLEDADDLIADLDNALKEAGL